MTSVALSVPERTPLELLRTIASKPSTHARFLNTVSMLEYIGARKIMKSQQADEMDMELLTHVSEESRHAWLVKRLAWQLDRESTRTYAPECLLCGAEGEAYIQELDAAVKEELAGCGVEGDSPQSSGWLNYLYTSLLIEERAEHFYADYAVVLQEHKLGGALKALIKDETKHLIQMARRIKEVDPRGEERLSRLRVVEKRGFQAFEDALWEQLEEAA